MSGEGTDSAFQPNLAGLARAAELIASPPRFAAAYLPDTLPDGGTGEAAALERLAPWAIAGAAPLGARGALAHMDPPTPWISWAATLWNAALNQNLLHPATGPMAREAEAVVVSWLASLFGMDGGWMCSGSTIANLTALWAARDVARARRVVASVDAHISVEKAARLLGLTFETVPVDAARRMRADRLPQLEDACLVLTAGTTGTGAIDDLTMGAGARWRHVDAAWAGPLRLSAKHAAKLAGIEHADSVAISAHKLMFQPKGSALVMFREVARVEPVLGFGSSYLAAPNLGVEGSRGATALPLLATLLAWGRAGLAARIERCMALADELEVLVASDSRLTLRSSSDSGVVVFRSAEGRGFTQGITDSVSAVTLDGLAWGRCACANPLADASAVFAAITNRWLNSGKDPT